uniref:Uncharacterized protein n=1 Tax=Timema monikensis TaxID=170555 RepID=A0A7R9EHR1_9NEOP|nr:unnamed protein product [Timema monikensis]
MSMSSKMDVGGHRPSRTRIRSTSHSARLNFDEKLLVFMKPSDERTYHRHSDSEDSKRSHHSDRDDVSNLIRLRTSALGQSAPSLSSSMSCYVEAGTFGYSYSSLERKKKGEEGVTHTRENTGKKRRKGSGIGRGVCDEQCLGDSRIVLFAHATFSSQKRHTLFRHPLRKYIVEASPGLALSVNTLCLRLLVVSVGEAS